jgi:proton-dependent oligopeptide transporter, POT family
MGNQRHSTSNNEFGDADNLDSGFNDDQPTEDDFKSLRRVADNLPWAVWYSPTLPCLDLKDMLM